MSKLILISGPSGSGKTHLAKYLSENLDIPYISKDEIKESLFDTLGWSDKEWSRKLGSASIKLLYLLLEGELRSKRSIIVEANFQPKFDTKQIEKLVARCSTEVLEVHCFADTEILLNRFNARVEKGDRHPGHIDQIVLDRYFDQSIFEPINVGKVIRLDTNDFSKVDFPNLLKDTSDFCSNGSLTN